MPDLPDIPEAAIETILTGAVSSTTMVRRAIAWERERVATEQRRAEGDFGPELNQCAHLCFQLKNDTRHENAIADLSAIFYRSTSSAGFRAETYTPALMQQRVHEARRAMARQHNLLSKIQDTLDLIAGVTDRHPTEAEND